MNILIVESAAKAKTINKYLGSGYKVFASFGHVRDLPAKDGSVLPDQDFEMSWDVDGKAQKIMSEIAKAVKGADKLILATDPDREGEAISWHILEILNQKKVLKGVRPYIRYFSSAKMLIDLPNEEVCIAMSWSGDYAQAMMRAQQVGRPVGLAYTTQREGTLAWFDLWFIPADAQHPDNAHKFLNYLMRPEVAAPIVVETRYATPNLAAIPLLPPEIRNDPAVFPPDAVRESLYKGRIRDPIVERLRSRLWSRVKTGL